MELRRSQRGLAFAVLIGALSVVPEAALAQQAPGEKGEEAQKLFLEGRDALARGERDVACSKFRGSLALAAMPNTIFNVAQCDEQEGRLILALQRWQQGVALLAEGDERLAVAKERAAAVQRKIPQVILRLAAGSPAGTRVTVDGVAIEPSSLGAPLPVDPGDRAIVVEAPGRSARRSSVRLAEGDVREIDLAPGPPAAGDVTPPPPPPESGNVGRTLGFVAGGIGVAGFVVAGVTGGLLLARDADIHKNCVNKVCNPEGREAIDSTKPLFVANTVGWIVGAAGIGAGVALLLFSRGGEPPKTAVAPAILPGGGGATLQGRF